MPSTYFIKRMVNFLLEKEERKNWIGLDVGCGVHLGVLAEYGLDAAPVKNFVNPLYPRNKFTQANIYDIPFEDDSFDYVVSSHVIEHLEEPEIAVKEMYRVAKKVVIANIPRYTLDIEKVTPCVKLDHYYLSEHPELWKKYKIKHTELVWQPGGSRFFESFEAPHCNWYPDPEDGIKLFEKIDCFSRVEGEVQPDNCGESNIYGYI